MRLAWQFSRNWQDAQDIVQESMFKAWKHRKEYDPSRPFANWFFRILRNVCLDWKRSAYQRLKVSWNHKYHEMPLNAVSDTSEVNLLLRLIRRLPARQRMIFLLKYQEGFEVPDIAEVMDISEDTVRVHLMKARRKLREMYVKLQEKKHDL